MQVVLRLQLGFRAIPLHEILDQSSVVTLCGLGKERGALYDVSSAKMMIIVGIAVARMPTSAIGANPTEVRAAAIVLGELRGPKEGGLNIGQHESLNM